MRVGWELSLEDPGENRRMPQGGSASWSSDEFQLLFEFTAQSADLPTPDQSQDIFVEVHTLPQSCNSRLLLVFLCGQAACNDSRLELGLRRCEISSGGTYEFS